MSREPLAAPIAVAMCIAFVLVAPLSWRVLFPGGLEFTHGAIRLLIYGAVGVGVVLVVGDTLPKLLSLGPTLLTMRVSLIVCVTLFLVGGWGLGRDIGFEESLARERARAERLADEAERSQLLALRSHLDPHFLFNTLNAIAEWCREDGEVAERAVLQLATILRAILAGVKAPSWPLDDELRLVRGVFALHLLRDPNLFELEWDVPPDVGHLRVPPMILLPIAENAVKHGPARGHRGVIRFSVVLEGVRLYARVENPGCYGGPRRGSDGLPTVERRLALAYGGEASLTIGAASRPDTERDRTRVELALPTDRAPAEAPA